MVITESNAMEIISDKKYPFLFIEEDGNRISVHTEKQKKTIAILPNITSEDLGSEEFKKVYGLKYAYYAGAMAGGISSARMCIQLGKSGFMGSYGSGGQSIEEVEDAIDCIQRELPQGPYLINLLANPQNSEQEFRFVEMLVNKHVNAIEASAFVKPTSAIVYYRLKGAKLDGDGNVIVKHHIIAKLSREEVARYFLERPEPAIVRQLKESKLLTEEEALCGEKVSLADDITVEADSGGHTDNRPLISMFPAMLKLRDFVQKDMPVKTRMGAAGGIASGVSCLCAFSMGADYVVTGSVNQSCVEAGTSDYVKSLLAKVKMADTIMCPSADMFESGSRVQVLKCSTMFGMRAQKLFQYYSNYPDYESIPSKDREMIEKRILQSSFDDIWKSTKEFFQERNPKMKELAEKNPKMKMALVFRWYLGKASGWAITDNKDRRADMQIWCGQSMGAFNLEVQGTKYEEAENRKVSEIADYIMTSAAREQNFRMFQMTGVAIKNLLLSQQLDKIREETSCQK